MSLQRRLLLYLLLCAPLVWGFAMWVSVDRARHEVNELFDTEMIRLARQVQATLGVSQGGAGTTVPPAPTEGSADAGEADVRDLAIAVWDRSGRLLLSDREGVQLPRRADASGFVDVELSSEPWRVYYLQSFAGDWLVAAGQKAYERDELVFDLTASQLAPWLLVLPVLLGAMTWAVRRALAPVHQLTDELRGRGPNDLQPVLPDHAPAELKPLLGAMNGLFERIDTMLARERRFTADAAHELRTPLAVLRAQWDVVRRSASAEERAAAEAKLGSGLDRMDRLVTQMLALSRLESSAAVARSQELPWPAIVEQVISDCLPLAERRHIELACDWPAPGVYALPLLGDAELMMVLLRNLLDNALRYAPADTTVSLRFEAEQLSVENAGEPLTGEQLARLGERFHRAEGQQESGSGLGLSIVQRIAALHRLRVSFGAGTDGRGFRAVLTRA
jgi:two-component system, OmpR family, sensor histidine kinase QseC